KAATLTARSPCKSDFMKVLLWKRQRCGTHRAARAAQGVPDVVLPARSPVRAALLSRKREALLNRDSSIGAAPRSFNETDVALHPSGEKYMDSASASLQTSCMSRPILSGGNGASA